MDESNSQYIYGCVVRTSSETYSNEKTDIAMFDDEPTWEIEDPSTAEPEPTPQAQPADGNADAVAPTATQEAETLKRPKYNHHWVRPKFLNYAYLYDYRKNYYDDVIDYMDRRQKGLYRETPRAQEWAERVMRTYDSKNMQKSGKRSADIRLLTQLRTTARYYSYHTRAYYSLKYQRIL